MKPTKLKYIFFSQTGIWILLYKLVIIYSQKNITQIFSSTYWYPKLYLKNSIVYPTTKYNKDWTIHFTRQRGAIVENIVPKNLYRNTIDVMLHHFSLTKR